MVNFRRWLKNNPSVSFKLLTSLVENRDLPYYRFVMNNLEVNLLA